MALPRRAFLGAELLGDAEAFVDGGVRVANVTAGGVAERAGVRGGDTLLALAGAPLDDLRALVAGLRRAGGLAEVEIRYRRGDRELASTVAVVPHPRDAGFDYGELAVAGATLRTLATRVDAPRALVLVLQGIAVESLDDAADPGAPLAELMRGWARAGIASLAFDKRGVGDSDGEPGDFTTERDDAAAALALARRRELPLVVFGHSIGGVVAPLLAHDLPLVVYGAPVTRWLDCLVASTRRQLQLRGEREPAIVRAVAELVELERRGELNGRSAAYHAQLNGVDVAAAWSRVTAPVLVVRGEHDWVVDAADQARIADHAAGAVTVVDVPGLDHALGAHAGRAASLSDYGAGRFDPAIVTVTAEWIASVAGR